MKIYLVDAFTDQPFKGNPAAVCIHDCELSESWMQHVAQEMNQSETAFLVPHENGFKLRWFTPNSEVDLCGHATLASAHILWERGFLKPETPARFFTKSGILVAQQDNTGWIELNFPATPPIDTPIPDALEKAFNIPALYVGKSIFDYIIEVESEYAVKNLNPNFSELMNLKARGVIVTAKSEQFDFVSRFFAPEVGIFEDPVTGSAHCCLGPYWQKKLGKDFFVAYQVSERGGLLKIKVAGDRVLIAGQAVTILEANLNVGPE